MDIQTAMVIVSGKDLFIIFQSLGRTGVWLEETFDISYEYEQQSTVKGCCLERVQGYECFLRHHAKICYLDIDILAI